MNVSEPSDGILERLVRLRALCPELRLGQLLCTIGMLAEDETGFSLWDVEDSDFSAAVGRFTTDMIRRAPNDAVFNAPKGNTSTILGQGQLVPKP